MTCLSRTELLTSVFQSMNTEQRNSKCLNSRSSFGCFIAVDIYIHNRLIQRYAPILCDIAFITQTYCEEKISSRVNMYFALYTSSYISYLLLLFSSFIISTPFYYIVHIYLRLSSLSQRILLKEKVFEGVTNETDRITVEFFLGEKLDLVKNTERFLSFLHAKNDHASAILFSFGIFNFDEESVTLTMFAHHCLFSFPFISFDS